MQVKKLNTTERETQKESTNWYSLYFLFIVGLTLVYEYWFSWSHLYFFDSGGKEVAVRLLENESTLIDLTLFFTAHAAIQLLIIVSAIIIGGLYKKHLFSSINKYSISALIYLVIKVYFYYSNSLNFPKSNLAWELPGVLSTSTSAYILSLLVACFIIFLPIYFLTRSIDIRKLLLLINIMKKHRILLLLFLSTAIPALSVAMFRSDSNTSASLPLNKNIILIGIDSVSARQLEDGLPNLPNLNKLISKSIYFKNTITPLARTFPAWNSVLTGLYPNNHGAVFNLTPKKSITKKTIAWDFKSKGYSTIFAQDERRFSNIDEAWGFKETVGPKIGALDFVLPFLADHPIASYFYTSQPGELLFPYIALNRASHLTYNPEYFIEATLRTIEEQPRPLFLATHFCLAHIPFNWASSEGPKTHANALKGLDGQIGQLINGLRKQQLLENTLFIVFSDHGETLSESPNIHFADIEKFVGEPTIDHEKLSGVLFSNIAGHGTNLNSRSQYNSFLFVVSGSKKNLAPKLEIDEYVSLTDVPKIIEYLSRYDINEFKHNYANKNQALRQLLNQGPSSRPMFLETGLFFSSITNPEAVNKQDLMKDVKNLYEVTDTGRLELKTSSIELLNKNKQRGVIIDNWLLYYLPLSSESYYILVNIATKEWTYDLDSKLTFAAPLLTLFRELKNQWPTVNFPSVTKMNLPKAN